MTQYEVTVLARLTHFFPADSEEDAEAIMMGEVPGEWQIEEIEVIELP
jgi:hypothetical protein